MKAYLTLTLIITGVLIILTFIPSAVPKKPEDISVSSTEKASVTETSKLVNETTEAENTEAVRVLRVSSGRVETVNLKKYLIGAVAGEMPASFSLEALKAQAVVSYSYIKWIMANAENPEASLSDITDSASNHQSYIDESQMKEKWGDDYEKNLKKIESAVNAVYGQMLTYNGEPAFTVFHALSSGYTLDAEDIWGKKVPYLTSVEAPGDSLSANFEETITITPENFKALFSKENSLKLTDDDPTKWAKVTKKDERGYILSLTVFDKTYTRTDVKRILSLPGICFKATIKDGNFVFTVHGKGHGLGMSQYSADFMARQGSTYDEILLHFYKGTTLEK